MPRLVDDPLATPAVCRSDRPQREHLTGDWRSLRPRILLDRCTRCMICWKYCPEACVSVAEGGPRIDLDYCKGCGICVAECPPRCIEFPAEPEEEACGKS